MIPHADDDDLNSVVLDALRFFDRALTVQRAVVDDEQGHLDAALASAVLAVRACKQRLPVAALFVRQLRYRWKSEFICQYIEHLHSRIVGIR